MTTILLTVLMLANLIALVWTTSRRDTQLRQTHDAYLKASAAGSPDLESLVALVDRLCQRIQAPEIAVGQHVEQSSPVYAPQPFSMDDDEAWLDKEDLADELMEQELRGAA